MAAGKLIANGNLAHFCYVNLNLHQYAGLEVITLFAGKDFYANNLTAVRTVHADRSIADVFCLFAEDCAEEAFLRAKLLFALWRNLTDEDIAVLNFGTNGYDTIFAEVAEGSFGYVWNITSNLFWTKLSFANLNIEVTNVNAS